MDEPSMAQNRAQTAGGLWATVPFLERLPAEVIQAIMAGAQLRRYAPGEIIFLEGEPTAGLFLVEAGDVRISRYSREGREYILNVFHRGDTFNHVSVLDGGPNPATAMAHTATQVWRITRQELQSIAGRYPALAWAIAGSMARQTRYLLSIVQDLSMRDVRGRLANLLLEQARAAERGESPPLLTQEEMASKLGTVREVVGRALRSLAAEGMIEFNRHRIVILDRERLAAEAEV
jgi:CRP/FNR family transcriptional regulator